MKMPVMIKSSKHGIQVYLNPDSTFNELLSEVEEKFSNTARFFHGAKLAVSFEGRRLTKPQEETLIDLISRTAGINIICIVNQDKDTEVLCQTAVERALVKTPITDGQFYRGTLRRRQILESESSIIILGDVEMGATVVAKGNIIVLGTLSGFVHAGAGGNRSSMIAALAMQPQQLKIAEVQTRKFCYDQQEEPEFFPQIAVLEGKHIYFDALLLA